MGTCDSPGQAITGLKRFVNENLKLVDDWANPASVSTPYDANISISSRKCRNDLQFNGKYPGKLKRIACLLICTENVNNTKITNNSTIESTSGSSGSTCQ